MEEHTVDAQYDWDAVSNLWAAKLPQQDWLWMFHIGNFFHEYFMDRNVKKRAAEWRTDSYWSATLNVAMKGTWGDFSRGGDMSFQGSKTKCCDLHPRTGLWHKRWSRRWAVCERVWLNQAGRDTHSECGTDYNFNLGFTTDRTKLVILCSGPVAVGN